jgi:hypothetical protein
VIDISHPACNLKFNDDDTIMKNRRFFCLCALLGILAASSPVSHAEETGGSIVTSLSSTTISGYVDSSISWQFSEATYQQPRGWWQRLLHWFRYQRH